MIPARRRAIGLTSRQLLSHRQQHYVSSRSDKQLETSSPSSGLTGSAKLLADAIEEELAAASPSRDHLRQSQGPVWTGDESTEDAVLRMLVDAHKPLRTGEGIKHNSADQKIKGWMKGLKLEPRLGTAAASAPEIGSDMETSNLHRTTIPPHLHRPWHSTYTGSSSQAAEIPQVKYGTFIKRRADGDSLQNILELQLPPGADGKTRARVKEARRSGKIVRRFEKAREGALDYRLGLGTGEGEQLIDAEQGEGEETFTGNRQVRGSSVLGSKSGGASGLRAWAGLVEDRIQVSTIRKTVTKTDWRKRAREAGLLTVRKGHGAPIPRDPEESNPHLGKSPLENAREADPIVEKGEMLMYVLQ